ncbi:MAG: response regulator [Patescibacteria group bacterium]
MENTNKKKILIVDDDKFLVNMYSIKFKAAGFDVCSAFDGQETLNKLKDGLVPDVVMLDMIMPSMDGVEILARIRKENLVPKAKVVILSNQNQPSDIERAKALGISGYIVKATTIPSEVVSEIQQILKESLQ